MTERFAINQHFLNLQHFILKQSVTEEALQVNNQLSPSILDCIFIHHILKVQVQFIYSHLFNYNTTTIRKKVKTELKLYIELNITREKSVWQPKEPSFRVVGYYHRAVTSGGGYMVRLSTG